MSAALYTRLFHHANIGGLHFNGLQQRFHKPQFFSHAIIPFRSSVSLIILSNFPWINQWNVNRLRAVATWILPWKDHSYCSPQSKVRKFQNLVFQMIMIYRVYTNIPPANSTTAIFRGWFLFFIFFLLAKWLLTLYYEVS
jgi:hypothetical protein